MPQKLVHWLLLAAFPAMVAACNTIEGFGQDVQAGGRAIERAADKSKRK
jgi:entericidin B